MILRKTPTCPYRVNLGYISDQKVFSPVATIHIDDLDDILSDCEELDVIMKMLRENKSIEVEIKIK